VGIRVGESIEEEWEQTVNNGGVRKSCPQYSKTIHKLLKYIFQKELGL